MTFDKEIIKAICFDVDGTLRDTDDEYVARFTRLLSPLKFLLPGRDLQAFSRRLVMWLETPANHVYSLPDWLGIDDDISAFTDWLYRIGVSRKENHFLLISGIREMLTALRPHYKMAVVSARPERGTMDFLRAFELTPFFECIASAQTTARTKPRPDPLFWAAECMGVSPEACLMVGDTTVDIRAGKAAGMQTIGVLCGLGQRIELEKQGANRVLETTADLHASLL
jgi:phosphoglycolate phosphatase-like HAD superfamily hydrolase